jgi:glycine/D-amino acid oxidase-like deaminating enzyme
VQAGRTNDDRVQVVVVGATVAGICAARWLAEAGTSVLLVGVLPPLDLGLVHQGLGETPARLRDSLGAERFAELTAFARRSPALIGASSAPGVWVAVAPGEDSLMPASARALLEAGVGAGVLDREALQARGIQADSGLLVPDEGLVDPGATRQAFIDAARAAGAVIAVGTDPVAVRRHGDSVLVELPDRQWAADVVIVADGRAGARLVGFLSTLLVPVREQALWAAGHLPPVVGRAGHGYTWFRPWSDGVAVGGCRWATPHLEVGETVPEVVPVVQARLEAFARDRLGLAEVRGRWAWIDVHSCDGLPIVGPVPGDGRWVVCAGFSGNEWGLGPAAARAVVDGLLGGPTPTPAMFSPSRFVG